MGSNKNRVGWLDDDVDDVEPMRPPKPRPKSVAKQEGAPVMKRGVFQRRTAVQLAEAMDEVIPSPPPAEREQSEGARSAEEKLASGMTVRPPPPEFLQ